jgi:CHAT domain-containing protein/tetratricopeptide (TPR) repeat protein
MHGSNTRDHWGLRCGVIAAFMAGAAVLAAAPTYGQSLPAAASAPQHWIDPASIPPQIRPPTEAENAQIEQWKDQAYDAESAGHYAEAERLYRKVLALKQATLGEQHPSTGGAYTALAINLELQRRYAEAEPLRRKALAGALATQGELADPYISLAANLGDQARYAEAEPLLRKALAINQATEGEQDPDTGTSYIDLADNLEQQGRYAEAEPLRHKALAIHVAASGEQGEFVTYDYQKLGANLDAQGRSAEAEPLLRKALAIEQAETKKGVKNSDMASATNVLAVNLQDQGRYAEAEPFFRKALAIRLAVLGQQNPETATSYHNLAGNLGAQGRDAEAEPLLRKAFAIDQAELGEQDPIAGRDYNSLAINLGNRGRHAEAERLYRKALSIAQATAGEQHPNTATGYNNLARNLDDQGRYAEAEPLAARAVDIVRRHRRSERQSGKPEYVGAHETQRDDGLGYVFETYLSSAYGLAASASAELPRLRPVAFIAAQDLDVSSAGEALAQAAVRVAAAQAGLTETVRRRQDLDVQARGYDAALLGALGKGDQTTAVMMRAERERADGELQRLDLEIREKFPRYAELISPEALSLADTQSRLQADEGLLLIVPADDDVHVFAVSKSRVEWRRLANGAKGVAEAVAALRCQLDAAACRAPPPATAADQQPSFDRARAYGLYRDLVQPVEGALGGVKTLYVTAAGPLSALPLSVLITEPPRDGGDDDPQTLAQAKWLADKYALITLPSVSSLRALGALKAPAPGRAVLAGFGAPVLEGPSETGPGVTEERGGFRAFRGVGGDGLPLADPETLRTKLPALPGAEAELKAMAAALHAPASAVRLGPEATETAVKTADLSQAQVVVFATHGLLPHEAKGLEEPGLVFTPPKVASEEDDGLLTASEAARLKLSADWVILSACNTASADGTLGGESLSSLAKAFLYAGARGLLASHWHVLDDATSALTLQTLAIQRADSKLSQAQALQKAMRAVRTGALPDGQPLPGWTPAWSHPTAWAPFSLISAGG